VRAEGGTVTAELIVSGGLVASVAFDSKWKLAEGAAAAPARADLRKPCFTGTIQSAPSLHPPLGGYYDVEANTREGDAAFLQRVPLPAGKDLASLPAKFFTSAVLGVRAAAPNIQAPLARFDLL
jgi:hypothetical protein